MPIRRTAWLGAAIAAALALAAVMPAGAADIQPLFFHLQSAVTLPGPVTGWDYLAFDAKRRYLFVDRRAQGVTVFDTRRGRVVTQIEDSAGADATVLVPEHDRGFTANRDGSTTIFQLSTLTTITRMRFGESADAGFYEPVTGQVMFTMGDDRALAFVDARTSKLVSTLKMDSGELEAAAADGKGDIFVNERDRDRVARVDAKAHKVTAEWPTGPCHQPVGMAYDALEGHILLGCRGEHPVLAAMDGATGAILTSLPIGRGNDTVIFDAARRLVYTSNGVDSNLVVLRGTGNGSYRLDQVVTTRPGARTMAFDPRDNSLFLVTAQGAVNPGRKIDTAVAPFYPNTYFPDTLTILTYAPE